MNKILLLGVIFFLSCNERVMVNKELIGIWVLEEIKCEKIDSEQEINKLKEYQNKYHNNFKLEIDENSKYVFIIKTEMSIIDMKTNTFKDELVQLEEHGFIVNEKNDIIEWKPNFIRENQKVSSNFTSGAKREKDFNLTYEFGPLPMKKTNESQFKVVKDKLELTNDVRLSYYENKTEFPKYNKQIETKLLFRKK
ncbi:MAG: hypothetical protein IPH94_08440 [Saprospiraceae bacterium]|nr:hypothetical protein [Saprospiraceae bacterium]MBL0084513.1 hypothetical protein [Saprospiraceae bacterium]